MAGYDLPLITLNIKNEHLFLVYRCTLLQQSRETLKKEISKKGTWPINKQNLIEKHLTQFVKFANSIDFDRL
jgi:hypothetical protein